MHVVAKLVAGFELQTQKHWNVRRELQRRERERERDGWGFRSRILSIFASKCDIWWRQNS